MATTQEKPDTLATALLGFQSAAPALQKDKINPHFRSRYLSLEALMEQVLPVLNENGLVLIQQPGYELVRGSEHNPDTLTATLTTTLLHVTSGDKLESEMLLMAAKDDPQGQGSAITYARRQAAMSMLGLVADADDDANRAQQQRTRRAASPAASRKPATPDPAPEPAPAPEGSQEAAQAADAAAATTPDDPAQTAKLVGLAHSLIADIQLDFGDHPDGMPWSDRMDAKVQEWFGHGLDALATQEASVLVQRLRATKTKLIADREKTP